MTAIHAFGNKRAISDIYHMERCAA